MRLKHSATSDTRWHDLVAKYQNNWVKACNELFGLTLTPHQRQIIDAVEGTGTMTTVSAGGGTGAHTAIAAIAILRVILFDQGRVVMIRPAKGAEKAEKVMAYMQLHWRKALEQYSWLDIYFKLTDKYLCERTENAWGMLVKSATFNKEERLAGEHAKHSLTIVLHAAFVSDKAFGIIRGGIFEEDNCLLLLSKPVVDRGRTKGNKGFFYDSHHTLSIRNREHGGYFTTLVLNGEDSPLVSSEYIEMKRIEYGGPDSNEYRQKMQGRFPIEVD